MSDPENYYSASKQTFLGRFRPERFNLKKKSTSVSI